ncbi:MAG: EAL domain-containing protein [Acidimicrobiales bacterium]
MQSGGSFTDATTYLDGVVDAALSDGEIGCVFQPIVELASERVVGFEALARFGPDRQGPAPDLVFAVARELGVADELQALAVDGALSARDGLPSGCFLSVNVGPECLAGERVQEALARHGRLDRVIVELTEHSPWQWNDLRPAITGLRRLGAQVAVDDMGTGYHGLRQILDLQPSILRLDPSLVQAVDQDDAKSVLVEMMGTLADRVGARLLAEGVETAGEAARLTSLGVPLGQGFHLGRPQPTFSER